MIGICDAYSVQWRYEYNSLKSSVIVFNEKQCEYHRTTRQWNLGGQNIAENEQYVHLGVICDKYSDNSTDVKKCNSK